MVSRLLEICHLLLEVYKYDLTSASKLITVKNSWKQTLIGKLNQGICCCHSTMATIQGGHAMFIL